MPKKITDITKKTEDPQKQEVTARPEQAQEAPLMIEVEKKVEITPTIEVPATLKAEEEKEESFVSPAPVSVPTTPVKSLNIEKIENVLQEDLEDIYFQMPPEKQAEFRQAGEETASDINLLLGAVKVRVKKILELIVKWLRIIPHVNKYFLEQEAKIKIDKLLEMKGRGEIPSSENQNKI